MYLQEAFQTKSERLITKKFSFLFFFFHGERNENEWRVPQASGSTEEAKIGWSVADLASS